MEQMNTANIAVIPLRGGSKSIPNKNIRPMAGRPMAFWAMDAAVNSSNIAHVYVPTDSQEIRSVLSAYKHPKVKIIPRTRQSATDTAPSEIVLMDVARHRQCDYVVLIQATSPLIKAIDIDAAFAQMRKAKADSALSVVKQKRFIWEKHGRLAKPSNYDPMKRPMRQAFDGYLVENGAFYITKRELLLETGCRISGKILAYEMQEESYYELDESHDWQIIEGFLRKNQHARITPSTDIENEIKLLAMDVDGVLTDGGMYYSSDGESLKKFNTRDGMGIGLLREAGVKTAFITGESTDIVRRRAEKLNIDFVCIGIKDKLTELKKICRGINIDLSNVAYVGDDVNDVGCLQNVGLSACPQGASLKAMDKAHVKLSKAGGDGCVREFCEIILSLNNKLNH